ncbi:MAG TPA: BTAD domain-containing putative transcriptional regulator, partial [Nocardioides sp.]|uniref:AfsR/SARP family transcriptional regulator n=1 Tax=Nocardioides sp. TaxID=35761 RepID=UPI002BF07B7C
MRVSVLGGTGVTMAGVPVDLGARKQRALVAALALHLGRPVSVDALIDLLWADAPPPGVAGTLQSYVAGLRRCLEPDRPPRAPATVLVTSPPGYALRLPADAVDAHRFEVAVGASHRVLDPLSPTVGAAAPQVATDVVADALARLDEALASWRGTPYLELDQAAGAVAERARLEELRLLALEDHAVAELALGRHATVAAELEALTASHPLRERLWGLRAVALA